jgi:hypothetical protein
MFPLSSIHEFTWTRLDGITNKLAIFWSLEEDIQGYLMSHCSEESTELAANTHTTHNSRMEKLHEVERKKRGGGEGQKETPLEEPRRR